MPVAKPERVLLHHVPLEFVRNRVSGGGRKSVDSSITLIPFIDFLVVLVVFLLISFGTDTVVPPSLSLPAATNVDNLASAPIIAINAQVVVVDGARVADTRSLAENDELAPIDALVQNLETAKRNWTITHPSEPFSGSVILEADREIDYRVVKKVMFSAAQAGYGNISFAVTRRAEASGGGAAH